MGTSVRETLVLVVGILIAFGLDSWWQGQSESRQQAADLAALTVDSQQNVGRLGANIERLDRISENSLRMVELSGRTEVPQDSARRLVSLVFSSRRFEPVLGAYQGIVGSGGLSRLENGVLRAALASFAAALEDPYAERFADALYFRLLGDFQGRLGILPDDGGDAQVWDHLSLLRDPRFREAVQLRALAEAEVSAHYRRLLTVAERVLSEIEER